jgi:hypothetical protein
LGCELCSGRMTTAFGTIVGPITALTPKPEICSDAIFRNSP